ncbi:MAG: MFS transporter [Promethearchaeota archaeon]|nr:MAG: MFS transporter [Candidatus Lokiarchaeota archaeon]
MLDKISRRENTIGFFLSFSLGAFLTEFIQGAYQAFGFFFYETEIKLGVTLVTVAFSTLSLFKAITDPILGYFLDKPVKKFEKLGKSFTWILISILPWFGSFILFYNTPRWSAESQQGLIFAWLLGSMLIYGFTFAIFSINYFGMIPGKFKQDEARRKVQGFMGIGSFFGMLLGALIPTFIAEYENIRSYATMSLIVVALAIIPLVGMIPGTYDPPAFRPTFTEHRSSKRESFRKMIKFALSHKNFRIVLLLSFTNQVIMSCVGGSLHYIIKYIYLEDIDIAMFFYIGYFSGALIGSFVWVKIAQKINNTKLTYLVSGGLMLLTQIPMFFIQQFSFAIASVFLFPFSFCFAGFWSTLRVPLSSDTLDELAIDLGRRDNSTFIGLRSIFFQIGILFQSLIFGLVHILTGFDKDLTAQELSAEYGIIFLFVGVPIILEVITFLIFWKKYDLDPKKVQKIKEKIQTIP